MQLSLSKEKQTRNFNALRKRWGNDYTFLSFWSRKNYASKFIIKKRNYVVSVSHTTRNPRPGEINNKDYYFVNDE